MKKIILASISPRRKALLTQIGLDFVIKKSPYKERTYSKGDPREFVKKQSYKKALAVARKHKNSIVIGADTIVKCNGKILEKPLTPDKARLMLTMLSGKKHTVITGFTIIDSKSGKTITGTEETRVFVRKLIDKEIDWYVETGEPLDKAGAYGIQEKGAFLIEKIEGDYFTVVGLPLVPVIAALGKLGIFPFQKR